MKQQLEVTNIPLSNNLGWRPSIRLFLSRSSTLLSLFNECSPVLHPDLVNNMLLI
jgi:hypothetical protein